jgi:hypothetical protein
VSRFALPAALQKGMVDSVPQAQPSGADYTYNSSPSALSFLNHSGQFFEVNAEIQGRDLHLLFFGVDVNEGLNFAFGRDRCAGGGGDCTFAFVEVEAASDFEARGGGQAGLQSGEYALLFAVGQPRTNVLLCLDC